MISGINERFVNKNIQILEVLSFTKELKERIESEFRVICHGEYALESKSVHFSTEESLEEFLNYRLPNGQNQKIGAIGEFLLNLLIREYTDLEIISPFFIFYMIKIIITYLITSPPAIMLPPNKTITSACSIPYFSSNGNIPFPTKSS